MSNYRAELRGFALDRILKMTEGKYSVDDLNNGALGSVTYLVEQLVDYLYIPDKDIKGYIDALVPLIAREGDLEKLDDLILQLQQIQAEMEADLKGRNKPVQDNNIPQLSTEIA